MLIIANQQFFLCSLALEFVYDKVIHINEKVHGCFFQTG